MSKNWRAVSSRHTAATADHGESATLPEAMTSMDPDCVLIGNDLDFARPPFNEEQLFAIAGLSIPPPPEPQI